MCVVWKCWTENKLYVLATSVFLGIFHNYNEKYTTCRKLLSCIPGPSFPSIQNSMQRKLVYFLIFLKSRWEPCLSHKLALVLKIPKKLHKSANCEPVSWLVSVMLLLLLLLLCAKPPQSVLPSPDEVSPLTDPGNDDWNKIVSLEPPPGCWAGPGSATWTL